MEAVATNQEKKLFSTFLLCTYLGGVMLRSIRLISVLFAISICLSGCENEKQYLSDSQETLKLMSEQTSVCVSIYQHYIGDLQFLNARGNLISANDFLAISYKSLVNNKPELIIKIDPDKIDKSMKKINKPPKKYEQSYNKMMELYGKYLEVCRFIRSPNVSDILNQSIGNKFAEIDTLKKQLEVMLDSKK